MSKLALVQYPRAYIVTKMRRQTDRERQRGGDKNRDGQIERQVERDRDRKLRMAWASETSKHTFSDT